MFIAILTISGIDQAILQATNINFSFLALAVLLTLLSPIIYSFSLNILLHFLGGKLSPLKMLSITITGFFVDNLLPNVAPGGEFTIAYLMNKNGVPYSTAFATVVAQMVAWFIGFVIFALSIILIVIITGSYNLSLLILIGLLLIMFIICLVVIIYLIIDLKMCRKMVSIGARWSTKLIYIITKKEDFNPTEFAKWADRTVVKFHTSVMPFLKEKTILFNGLLMSFQHFSVAFSFYMVTLAFGISMPVHSILLIYLAVTLLSLLSFLPGGLGVFEIATITLTSIGAGIVGGTIITGVFRLISYWLIMFIGGFLALHMGIEKLIEKEDFKF